MNSPSGVSNGTPSRFVNSPSRESSVGPAGSDTSESSVDSPNPHKPKKLFRIRSRAGELTFGKLLTNPTVSCSLLFVGCYCFNVMAFCTSLCSAFFGAVACICFAEHFCTMWQLNACSTHDAAVFICFFVMSVCRLLFLSLVLKLRSLTGWIPENGMHCAVFTVASFSASLDPTHPTSAGEHYHTHNLSETTIALHIQ